MTDKALTGVHHVSTLSKDIAATHDFFIRVMGLRLVLRSVNQDSPDMYHLFFGDGIGSPGSDLTVFGLKHAARERRGNNSISRTTFRVSGGQALDYWQQRLSEHGVTHTGVYERDGRAVIDFDDPEGTQLSLVDDGGAGGSFPWEMGSVPAGFQLRGLGYVMLTVPEIEATDGFLTGVLGMERLREYRLPSPSGHDVAVYQMQNSLVQGEMHVIVRPDLPRARYGAGGVHHVAVRVPHDADMAVWDAHIKAHGFSTSGLVDRHYFRSLYVREKNGILFELATDGPGFAVDGPLDGDRLSLPPFLEARRGEIESRLGPLQKGRSGGQTKQQPITTPI